MAYTSTLIIPVAAPMDPLAPASPVMREAKEISKIPVSGLSNVPGTPDSSGTGQLNTQVKPNVPEESGKTEAPVTLSPQMAALARKEQAFRREQQKLKQQQKALEAERSEIAQLRAMKEKLANKDFSGVEELVPYNDYSNYLIEKGSNVSPELQRMQKLEAELEALKQTQSQEINGRFEEAVNQRRIAIKDLVESDVEFSTIKEFKAQEAVVQHILDTWEADDEELSVEQATKEVEQAIYERELKRAEAWERVSKLKNQRAKEEPAPVTVQPKKEVQTLTNQMTPSSGSKNKSFQGMTEREAWQEAIRRARELNK